LRARRELQVPVADVLTDGQTRYVLPGIGVGDAIGTRSDDRDELHFPVDRVADDFDLRPLAHIFVASKAPWHEISHANPIFYLVQERELKHHKIGRAVKRGGPIWLGLSRDVRSLRSYPHIGDLRRMIARSAYSQLRYSPLLLAATISGMALTFFAPPVLALLGGYPANAVAAGAWALMTLAYLPILSFYGLSLVWAPALPLIALAYLAFTLDSAFQHWRGRGGVWKGRSQASLAKR
jgi:hypothetical protein